MIFNPRVVQLTGARIALLPPSDLAASAGNTQVSLTWTDPGDETSGGQVVAEWEFTRIVRKVGSAPANQNDGVIVVDSTIKNQYLSEPFVDTGLTNGTTYYYGAFACSAAGAWSDGAFVSAVPVASTPIGNLAEGTLITIKENGAPVEFYVACQNYQSNINGDGRTLMVRKDCYQKEDYYISALNNYVGSTLDTWCRTTYISFFSNYVKTGMASTIIKCTRDYPETGVVNVRRPAFVLSLTEYGFSDNGANTEGNPLPISGTLRTALLNGIPIEHWTRTRSKDYVNTVYVITASGGADISNALNSGGYRPCFTLPSTFQVDTNNALIES